MRVDQTYLRSQAVSSEEGAPRGSAGGLTASLLGAKLGQKAALFA